MNANAIRVHSHVAGRALYDVADEMGLMIWQDVPCNGVTITATPSRIMPRDRPARWLNSLVIPRPLSSGAVITSRHGIHRGWKNAFPTGIKPEPDADETRRRRAFARYLAHSASFFCGGRTLLGRMVLWHHARSSWPRQNRDHHGVWRSGATATLNPENHHSRPPDVAEKHRRRRSRLDALEIP